MKNLVNIKSAKLMTVEEMNKNQSSMTGKYLVAPWHFPYEVYQFNSLTPNKDKATQLARGDEYADYMPDFNFEVTKLNGKVKYLDGHNGTKYFVFDDVKTAKQAVRDLNTLEQVDRLENVINHHVGEIKKDLAEMPTNIPQALQIKYKDFLNQCEVMINNIATNKKLLITRLSNI